MKQEQILSSIARLIRQNRRQEITALIFDPALIERSDLIPDGDPVKTEARILSDALESITNGMYNPEALTALDAVGTDSPFYGWKKITLSLQAFYNGGKREALDHLSGIPSESPASSIVPVIRRLCGERAEEELSRPAAKLFARITEDRSFITSAQSQLKECLDADMEELFIETALLLVRDLKGRHPTAARKFSLWLIKSASLYGYSPELIVSSLKNMFGPAEGSRLCAIALRDEEPEISLLFWIRALLSRMKLDDLEVEERNAYLDIISHSAAAAGRLMKSPESAEEAGYEEDEWQTYIRSLSFLASEIGGFNASGASPSALFDILASIGDGRRDKKRRELPGDHPVPAVRERRSAKPLQLELFS